MQYVPPVNGDVGNPDRSYVNANVSIGLEGSIPDGRAIEHPIREIVNVIGSAGLTPDEDDLTQLDQAIDIKIAAAVPTINLTTGYSDLYIYTTGVSPFISVVAKEIALHNGAGSYVSLHDFAATINCAAIGKNGLSVGALAASTGYYIYAGFDGTSDCAWIDPSPTAPTVPASVTHWKRVGWISTDSSVNKYPLHFIQKNQSAQLVVSSAGNVQSLPILASGAAGSFSVPTYVAVSLVNKVPATASKVSLVAYRYNTAMIVAPNNNYGAAGSPTNPPPHSNQANDFQTEQFEMMLESMNIYYASNAGASTLSGVNLFGWTDNL